MDELLFGTMQLRPPFGANRTLVALVSLTGAAHEKIDRTTKNSSKTLNNILFGRLEPDRFRTPVRCR